MASDLVVKPTRFFFWFENRVYSEVVYAGRSCRYELNEGARVRCSGAS
jgi:hypothetical protein